MDPADFHTLALRLIDVAKATPSAQAECRSAISRSYYAAYNAAVALLDSVGFRTEQTGSSHHVVQRVLIQCESPALSKAGINLGSLYSSRLLADYQMANPVPESVRNAAGIAELAGQVIASIRASTAEEKGQFVTVVLRYLEHSKTSAIARKTAKQ